MRTATGPAGEFLFTQLPAGDYRLQFRKSGYRKVPGRAKVVSLTVDKKVSNLEAGLVADVYYPNALSPSQSTPLKAHWGQELTDMDLELPDEPAYWVAGAVFDGATGDGCFDCTMRIARLDGRLIQTLPNPHFSPPADRSTR